MTVSVRLNLSKLRRVIQGEQAAIDRGARKVADRVAELAEQLAPFDTGELRDSIHVEEGDRPGMYQVVASAPYAVFVEYGTHKMPAQPFFTPALRRVDALAIIGQEIRELIR
jgi:HK97 gp10 family phage protein